MFSVSTSQSSLSTTTNTTSSYGLLTMAIEVINYWITGVNHRVSDEVKATIQSREAETNWDTYSQHLRRLTGPEGNEFQVNTYTNGNQAYPSVATLSDGGFVITWESSVQDGSNYGIYAQRYTASSTVYGAEFQVNTYTNSHQRYPAVAALTDGGFVITWVSNGQDGSADGIYAQRYTASSSTSGVEFQVNTYTNSQQGYPAVAGLNSGGFVVTWESDGQDGSSWGIYAQRYTASSNAYGGQFQVNTYTNNFQRYPAIAALSDGGFVIAWNSDDQDGSEDGIYAQRYTASSTVYGGEFHVNTFTSGWQRNPVAAALSDGGFVITWFSYGQDGSSWGVYAQRYTASGAIYGGEFQVNTYTSGLQLNSAITALSDGGFVITWMSNGQDGFLYSVYAQRYTVSSSAYGVEFLVTDTYGYQGYQEIAALADGGFVITWVSNGQDGSGDGIYAKQYDANSYEVTKSPTAFPTRSPTKEPTLMPTRMPTRMPTSFPTAFPTRVPTQAPTKTPTHRPTLMPTVSLMPTRAPTVSPTFMPTISPTFQPTRAPTWMPSASPTPILLTGPQGAEFQVNTYTNGYQWYPAIAALSDGGFVMTWESSSQDGSGSGIYAQRYMSASAAFGSEFQVNTYALGNQDTPAVAGLSGGGFVATWASYSQDGSGWGVYAQRYTAVSAASGSEFRVNTYTNIHQDSPAVAGLSDGGFVITWVSEDQEGHDGARDGVYAQRYTAGGSAYGVEFRVNTYTSNYQRNPAVAALTNGGFVITWESNGQDGSYWGVYAQRYLSPRTANGAELRVNTVTSNAQYEPAVAGLSDGGFVVTWESADQDGSGYGIYMQRYTSTGAAYSVEFPVNTYTSSSQTDSAVAGLADGGFVITWASRGQDGSGSGIYAQRYTLASIAYGSEFRVNSYLNSDQYGSAVAALSDGGFVITWVSSGQDGSGSGIYAKQYDANSHELTQSPTTSPTSLATASPTTAPTRFPTYHPTSMPAVFSTHSPTALLPHTPTLMPTLSSNTSFLQLITREVFVVNNPSSRARANTALVGLSDGGFVVTWASDGQESTSSASYGIYARRYNELGQELGNEFRVNTVTSGHQESPAIASLSDNRFVITWASDGQDGSSYGVYAQRYASSGETYGGEFQVNNYNGGAQKHVAVTGLSDGGFVVSWESDGQDGSGYGIYAQRYDSASRRDGTEFQVNSYTADDQRHSAVSALLDGGFVVAWESNGQDGSGNGVYARCFDSLTHPLVAEFRVNSYASGNQQSPRIAQLTESGFVITWESDSQDGSDYGIYAQRYTAACVKEDSEFSVNSHTTGAQRYPSVSGLDDGGFMIAWTDENSAAGFGSSVHAQRYDAFGLTQGDAFQVSEESAFDQTKSALAQIHHGMVASWESRQDSDSQDKDILGRRYATSGHWPSNSGGGSGSSNTLLIIIAIAVPVGLVALGICVFCFCCRKKQDETIQDIPVAMADPVDHNAITALNVYGSGQTFYTPAKQVDQGLELTVPSTQL